MHKRKIKLIHPKLQLRLVAAFVSLSALALLFQLLLFGMGLAKVAASLPEGGSLLASRVPGMLVSMLGVSLGISLPIIFGIGVLITHKIVGPIFRLECYLDQLARGEDVGPCKIRTGDEFQSLCKKLNDAVAALRAREDQQEAGEARRAA